MAVAPLTAMQVAAEHQMVALPGGGAAGRRRFCVAALASGSLQSASGGAAAWRRCCTMAGLGGFCAVRRLPLLVAAIGGWRGGGGAMCR